MGLKHENTGIIDNIENLSAVTQQVSTHANETYNSSEKGMEIMEDVVAMVEQIREKVRELEHGTTSEEDAEENAT